MSRDTETLRVSRRKLLVGGGAGVGLLVAWSLWPRKFPVTLRAAPGESLFNAYLRIGSDGRVIVAVPQAELGQGVYTSLPQILADELGADWRSVSVEPAPLNPIYGNPLLAQGHGDDDTRSLLGDVRRWAVREYSAGTTPMITGGSTSIRAYEGRMREAGAAGRALLSKAAAERWDVEWQTLETRAGFVWNGKERISFGELAEAAARADLPEDLPVRGGAESRLVGQSVPRIDVPSKIDGSAQFAGDIRLADMVFGSVRQGPTPDSRLVRIDRGAAQKVPGVVHIFEEAHWAGAVATTWWAANRAVEAMRPRFETSGFLAGTEDIDRSLRDALETTGSRLVNRGDARSALASGEALRATYAVEPAVNAALEPLTATVRPTGDRLEVWAPTQAPEFARAAAARAAGVETAQVTLYPTIIGGGYGRKLETAAIEQAVVMALAVRRPVQLTWSRIEESLHDSFRPPARAELMARLGGDGAILAWQARIAAPATASQVAARLRSGRADDEAVAESAAIAGALPAYAIPDVSIEHCPVAIGVQTGLWRSAAHSYTAFFTECFVDELARQAKVEPLSFRIRMLGDNPRFAQVLSTATMLSGWDGGGPGSSLGLAAHHAFGSYAALVVEVELDKDQRVRVTRAVCAVDCGRVINPEIVRQQIEGAIIFGIAAATGNSIRFERGLPTAYSFDAFRFPTVAKSPEVTVELIPSEEDPGGITELGVPPAAPAVANALFALTGQRLRSLPLVAGTAR